MHPLYDALLHLPQEQWSALRVRLRDFDPYLPAPSEPRATQVLALVTAADRQHRESDIRAELARVQAFFAQTSRNPELWLDVLRERHGELRVLGLFTGDANKHLSLDDLFVALDIVRADVTERRAPLSPRTLPIDSARDLDAALRDLPWGKRGIVLVGLPGCGKTTLLQHAWCRAHDAWRADRSQPLPLLLRCSTLQHVGVTTLQRGDLRRLVALEAAADGFPGAEALLDAHRGPLLVLLDGLDELRDPDDRRRVAEWVCAESAFPLNSRWVVTSRSAAWGDTERATLGERLLAFDVLSLTPEAIDDYIRKWFDLMAEQEGAGLADRRRAEIVEEGRRDANRLAALVGRDSRGEEGERVRTLTGNPLTLSTVCLVYRRFHELPRGRGRLYGYCLEVLLRGRYAPGKAAEFDRDDGVRLLRQLAWRMQESAEDARSPKEVTREFVLDALADARRLVAKLAHEAPEELLRRLVADCGVLYTADHARYQFIHLTVQEFLATEHARAKNLGATLAACAGQDRWREPTLLAMAEPGLQSAFYTAILRPGVATHADLLRACLVEADPDPDPFVAFLDSGAPAADLTAILRLFLSGAPPAIQDAAKSLRGHDDRDVRDLARRVCGESAAQPLGAERKAGDRMHIDALGMDFVWIPPGEFWMGASKTGERNRDPDARENEGPVHEVIIKRGYWLGRVPVTVQQYRRGVDLGALSPPNSFRRKGFDDPGMPVTEVSWDDAVAWCTWASRALDREVRLPTEAEWEYACRAGTSTPYACPDEELDAHAWIGRNSRRRLHAAGELRPNPWGLHDMHGNVWEWCADTYGRYGVEPRVDMSDRRAPRVVRGGSWGVGPVRARSAYRYGYDPVGRYDGLGFRVLLPAPA